MKIIQKLLHKVSLGVPSPRRSLSHPHPASDDRDAWHAYWTALDQPWRTELEIDLKRQEELAQRRTTAVDVEKGIYPFKGMKLDQADIEWLLATHENGRGPVNWDDETQREREGLDLRGAELDQVWLSLLPLARLCAGQRMKDRPGTEERRNMALLSFQGVPSIEGRGAYLPFAHLEGAELGGVHLEKANLRNSHLEEIWLVDACLDGADLAEANLNRASLGGAQLNGANLLGAQLNGAYLPRTQLCEADLRSAQLNKAYLVNANLEGADLSRAKLNNANLDAAHLGGARLVGVQLKDVTLNNISLTDRKNVGPYLADISWGDTNLTVVKWSQVIILGDEYEARQKKDTNSKTKDRLRRLEEHEAAVRANRQLAVVLQAQGLNEQAARFAYRAQVVQRYVFWFEMVQHTVKLRQRGQALGAWLFSWFLFFLAGYGYKPGRSFFAYLLVIVGFTTLYLGLDGHLAWYEAVVVSMTAFHGRGFSPSTFSPGDPLSIASAFEAFVGLIIEVTFIATLTQRFFNK